MLDKNITEVLGKLRWFGGAAFLLEDRLKIYFDPYNMPDGLPAADIVFITHNHPEYCSIPDVTKVSKIQTIVVGPADCACRFRLNQLELKEGQTKPVLGLTATGIAAAPEGIGFLLDVRGVKIFHTAGIPEAPKLEGLEADIALLPMGAGLMDPREAAAFARRLKARAALPMDFAPGDAARAEEFAAAARAEGIEAFVPQRAALSPR
jgi:L-ascorbate metabolism protein UlaG (beta-lactamase superfamily)